MTFLPRRCSVCRYVYKFLVCVYICCTMNYAPFLNGVELCSTQQLEILRPRRGTYSNPKKSGQKRRRAKQERQSSSKTQSTNEEEQLKMFSHFLFSTRCWLCILFLYDAAAAQERILSAHTGCIFILFIYFPGKRKDDENHEHGLRGGRRQQQHSEQGKGIIKS